MKNILSIFFFFCITLTDSSAQDNTLPIKTWEGNTDSLFVLYISGDGGMNSFSTDLCTHIHQPGYSVTAINAKSYFWSKKTPEQAAIDISNYLQGEFAKRKNQQLVLAGYSFGADVLPFIVNKLPQFIQQKLSAVILLSPGTTTDFEVHWSDILGFDRKRSMNVKDEIGHLQNQKIIILAGSDENSEYANDQTNSRYVFKRLPGGHHFANDIESLATTFLSYFH